jgi:preprotein translocase subunit YajC
MFMPQPTSTTTPPPPSANVTRSDGVVGGSTPATGAAGTKQPATDGNNGVAQQQQGVGGLGMIIWVLPLIMIVFLFISSRTEKKKRAEVAATLASLQRNDKVQTIGGMIGNVAEMTDTEVVLRVDEITNTRVRVMRSAITAVLNRATPAKGDGVKAAS